MRRAAVLLALIACGSSGFAFGSPDEEEVVPPSVSPSASPTLQVRLVSLGAPARVVVRAEGLRVTDAATGAALPVEASAVTLSAAGKEVVLGEHRAAELRLEAASLSVEVGRARRVYPGALVVTAKPGGLSLSNRCSLEQYTVGVLAGECPALFHREAIKAMAVAARSYSYRKAFLGRSRTDLCDTTHCQVYLGTGSARPSIRQAVEETAGLCALYEGEVIDAVYSSDCGGYTEANEAAWKGAQPVPYLRPVEDAPEPQGEPYCAINRSHRWTLPLSRARLQALLGKAAPALKLEVVDTTESGRVRRLQIAAVAQGDDESEPAAGKAARVFSGDEWRRMLGLSAVKSLRFEPRETSAGVELAGRGWGHGVGLCQYGANGMGHRGADFEAILKHYYTGVEVGAPPAPASVVQARTRPVMASRP